MPTTLKAADFTTAIAGGIRDHDHAHALINSFLTMNVRDTAFFAHAPIAVQLITRHAAKIKQTLDGLSEPDKTAMENKFIILLGQLEAKRNHHESQEKSVRFNLKPPHGELHKAAQGFVDLVQNTILPLFSVDIAPTASSPKNLFEPTHTDDMLLLLFPKIKEGFSEEEVWERLSKKVIDQTSFRDELNRIYTIMRSTASGDKPFMKKKGLRDNPVLDLGTFIDDTAYLPGLKTKLDPLYKKVRDTLRSYEKAIDIQQDTGWWVKPKSRKGISLDPNSNDQLLRESTATTGPVDGDYLFTDGATVTPRAATAYIGHTRKMSVVDDKGNDCTGFVERRGGDFHLKTEDLLKKYPDVAKLTITRPMLLHGEWTNGTLREGIRDVSADFVDEITFGGLDTAVRDEQMRDFFADTTTKEKTVLGLCAPDATKVCTGLLKALVKKDYTPEQIKYIHDVLKSPVDTATMTLPISTEEAACYDPIGATPAYIPTHGERLLYAYLMKKAEGCRTPEAYEKVVDELIQGPQQAFSKDIDKRLYEDMSNAIDLFIAANPPVDIVGGLGPHTGGAVDINELMIRARTPDANAPEKWGVNKRLDDWLGTGGLGKKIREGRLWRKRHSRSPNSRILLSNPNDIHDYWFLMGLGDSEGSEQEKKMSFSGDVMTYTDVACRISILSPTSIDVDVTVPAQGGSPELVFDGNSGSPNAIRTQMDGELIAAQGRDRKLAWETKMYVEQYFYDRIASQNGDVSVCLGNEIFILKKGTNGLEIHKKTVGSLGAAAQVYKMSDCTQKGMADVFLKMVRDILDQHCAGAKQLLLNNSTDVTEVITDFPRLRDIEAANGSTPDDYNLDWSAEKTFNGKNISFEYKGNKRGTYKLYVTQDDIQDEFDSIGEVVMSSRFVTSGLDIMHWFHEQLLEEFLLNRKDLPKDRTYMVQDPMSGYWYGFYHDGVQLRYGSMSLPPTTPAMGLTTGQKARDADPDPKQRCVMYSGLATFDKGTNESAKKTIFGRKDMFYSLLFSAMATSNSGAKERERIKQRNEETEKKIMDTATDWRGTLSDLATYKNIRDIVRRGFGSTKKK